MNSQTEKMIDVKRVLRVFVHKYKHSHEKRRKVYRKLYKQGKVKRERVFKGWLYTHLPRETANGFRKKEDLLDEPN